MRDNLWLSETQQKDLFWLIENAIGTSYFSVEREVLADFCEELGFGPRRILQRWGAQLYFIFAEISWISRETAIEHTKTFLANIGLVDYNPWERVELEAKQVLAIWFGQEFPLAQNNNQESP